MARAAQCQLCPPSVTQVMGGHQEWFTPPLPVQGCSEQLYPYPGPTRMDHQLQVKQPGCTPSFSPPGTCSRQALRLERVTSVCTGQPSGEKKMTLARAGMGSASQVAPQETPDCPSCESQGPVGSLSLCLWREK